MRSYRLCYRSEDFKTLSETVPPGLIVSNPGTNAGPGQVAKMLVNIKSLFAQKPFFAIQAYNRLARPDSWVGFDVDGNPIDAVSGITFANIIFDVQFYSTHPKN